MNSALNFLKATTCWCLIVYKVYIIALSKLEQYELVGTIRVDVSKHKLAS